MVHVVLKNKLKANLIQPRDCAPAVGLTYNSLMQKLNGFSPLSPELESAINQYIERCISERQNQPYQGGKLTREFKGDLMTREGR